jgi:hypothetical protein
MPEFVDQYPQSMPIIYMRAKVGATAGVAGATDSAACQYNLNDLGDYGISTTVMPTGSPFASWVAYFTNTSLTNVAKRQDTYMLISPGADRTYGTTDDICNFSF